jgi:hypothetical protein
MQRRIVCIAIFLVGVAVFSTPNAWYSAPPAFKVFSDPDSKSHKGTRIEIEPLSPEKDAFPIRLPSESPLEYT